MSTATLRPIHNAPGYEFSGVNDWASVSDASDTTYLTYAIPDPKTGLYKIAAPPFYGAISAVAVYVRARTVGTCSFKLAVRSHGYTYHGDANSLTSSFADYSYSWSNNPNTGMAWTVQEVADLCAGFWASGSSAYTYISDVWVVVTYTASASNPIGQFIYPTSDNTVALTPSTGSNYACVDDPQGSPNDDTDYVRTNASAWQVDLYNMGDLSSLGEILWVKIVNRVAKVTSGGTLQTKTALKTHSTVYECPVVTLNSTSYENFQTVYGYNPYTGEKWIRAEINDLLAGVQLYTSLAGYNPKCTQVYVEVYSLPRLGSARAQIIGLW